MSTKENNMKFIGPTPTREEQVEALTEIDADYQMYIDRMDSRKRERLYGHINSMRHGLHSIAPRICTGPEDCIIIKHCPIPTRNEVGELKLGPAKDYPVAQACVLEKFYLQQKLIDYVQHLNVNPSNPVEMSIVNELAILDLMKNRALMILSSGDRDGQGSDFLRVDVAGYTDGGAPIEKSQLHPVVEVLDRLERRREKWLDKLDETRKAQNDRRARAGTVEQPELLREIQRVRGILEELSSADQVIDLNEKIPLDE